MSARYEWVGAADCPVRIARRGEELGQETVTSEMAVVLGDPWATAMVLEGSYGEMAELLGRLNRALIVSKAGLA